jgi:hypothetical protein
MCRGMGGAEVCQANQEDARQGRWNQGFLGYLRWFWSMQGIKMNF